MNATNSKISVCVKNKKMLSNTCKYAIRAVIYLAINGQENKKIGIKKISEDLTIPTPFLGKILQSLARHRLLVSTKGPHGGFGLAKQPDEIRLIDIVDIIDGLAIFENCFIGMKPCRTEENNESPCAIHAEFKSIRDSLLLLFRDKTIGELLGDISGSDDYISL